MIKREAALSFNSLNYLFNKEEEQYLSHVIEDSSIMERILLNSDSLYEKIQSIKKNNKKLDMKTRKSLIKYLLRMGARPQPFRLNSGLCEKNLSKNEIKTVEISLEWRVDVLNELEDILLESGKVKLIASPFIYNEKAQYILEKVHKYDKTYVYLKSSQLVSQLLRFLSSPKRLSEIVTTFNVEEKILISEIVKPLLKEKVLHIENSISTINNQSYDFFNFIYSNLDHGNHVVMTLKEIEKLVQEYQYTEVGQGIDLYKNLILKMSAFCKSSNYLNINLYRKDYNSEEVIPYDEDFQDNLKIMYFFDRKQTYDWESYQKAFINKFGLYSKVPLLKVIDKYEGIGLPQKSYSNDFTEKIEKYILNKILKSSYDNKNIVKLTTNDFDALERLVEESISNKIHISYDCKFVQYNDQRLLPPNAFSHPRYSFTGRFSLENKNEDIEKVSDLHEIAYLPNRFKDVGQTYKSEGNTYIDCIGYTDSSKKRIGLNDIYIFIDNNKLLLCDNEQLINPTSTHLLNYRQLNEHPAITFLYEYSLNNFTYPRDFPIDKYSFLEYVPRLEYKNLIISLARINIRFEKETCKEERIDKIRLLINKYKLNRFKYIYIVEGDRAIPVPTNNEEALDFIESNKRKHENLYYLTLMESPELDNIPGEEKVHDYIYSSRKHDSNVFSNYQLPMLGTYKDSFNLDYSSYEVYYREGKREKTEKIIRDTQRKLQLENMFLINYIDNNGREHIRIRYSKDKNKDRYVEEYLNSLILKGTIYDFSKVIFIPETNRYGGKDISKIAYRFFSIDTEVMEIIRTKYEHYNKVDRVLYLTSFTLLALFDNNLESLYAYLDSVEKDSIVLKKFSKNRKYYCDIILETFNEVKRKDNEILENYKKTAKELYESLINETDLDQERVFYILKSIVHMSINRHFPFEREIESKANQLMRFSVYNLKYVLEESEKFE